MEEEYIMDLNYTADPLGLEEDEVGRGGRSQNDLLYK